MNSIRKRRQRELTAISVYASESLEKEEAEQILSQFIEATSDKNPQNLNQLKRVQRNLRGLPPLLANEITNEKSEKIIDYENDEIMHNDISMEGNETMEEKSEEMDEAASSALTKEEQKKLKKELKKKEKKKEKKSKENHKKNKKDKKNKIKSEKNKPEEMAADS